MTSPVTTSYGSLAIAPRNHAPVWIDIGDHDYLRPGAEALARELKADGAGVTFHVWPGIHNGRYWDAHFAQYLRFYARSCGG